jgi:excisionase family DNA binding protein
MIGNGIPTPRTRLPGQPSEESRATVVPITPLLLDAKQAAKALGISERTLWSLTAPRGPIRAIRIGRAVRYSVRELERFIEQSGSE